MSAENNVVTPEVVEAIGKIVAFVESTSGKAPSSQELGKALTRYFVMTEICGHIEMARKTEAA